MCNNIYAIKCQYVKTNMDIRHKSKHICDNNMYQIDRISSTRRENTKDKNTLKLSPLLLQRKLINQNKRFKLNTKCSFQDQFWNSPNKSLKLVLSTVSNYINSYIPSQVKFWCWEMNCFKYPSSVLTVLHQWYSFFQLQIYKYNDPNSLMKMWKIRSTYHLTPL